MKKWLKWLDVLFSWHFSVLLKGQRPAQLLHMTFFQGFFRYSMPEKYDLGLSSGESFSKIGTNLFFQYSGLGFVEKLQKTKKDSSPQRILGPTTSHNPWWLKTRYFLCFSVWQPSSRTYSLYCPFKANDHWATVEWLTPASYLSRVQTYLQYTTECCIIKIARP
jgi:hypothetical protein